MTWEIASGVLLDALKDSALVFAFVFLFHFLLSLVEDKIASTLVKRRFIGPIFGSLFGIIPQCGTSVLGADLYAKKYITMGTLISIFLSCSDEALILLLTHPSEKTWFVIPLIASKIIIGMGVGILVDLIFKKQEVELPEEEVSDVICEDHHHKDNHIHKHLIHPLIHSLEIFAYVFVVNVALGLLIAGVGEQNFSNFVVSSKYFGPLFASVVGLIPNCASSVLLSELFLDGSLSFGSLLAGLLVNSGLGLLILIKKRKTIKNAFIITLICFLVAVIFGYIFSLIFGF